MYYEIWKDVPGYRGLYMVSNHGRVKKPGSLTTRAAVTNHGGYQVVCLSKQSRLKGKLVHRLVCEAFIGPCPKGMECSHYDDDPKNNHIYNLSWQPQAENMRRRDANGGTAKGSRVAKSKLTETSVHMILAMLSSGNYRQWQIAEKFNVSPGAVSGIAVNKTWKHVPRPYLHWSSSEDRHHP